MWFKREQKNRNRRLHRHNVLDVKLRSDQVRATRMRLGVFLFLAVVGPFFGIYLLWRIGEVALNTFVYCNSDFAIQRVDVKTDGIIAPEQLRRWAGVKPGANLIALDLARVKQNLEQVPMIDSVSVERVLPRTLKIRVTERDPIAQVIVSRLDGTSGGVITLLQLDADGVVMPMLDPRLATVPSPQLNVPLPLISGLNASVSPGDRIEQPQVQAALQLIVAFAQSPMAGLVDLRRVDVGAPGVIVATTGQGSSITFSLDNMDQQLRRWRSIYDYGRRMNKGDIASVDLSVKNNLPVHWMVASSIPATMPKAVKPKTTRRKNV